ncbi:MauE/DoxX family redox-associated membrane protein [Thermosporothrix hazakensis]|nr:MauE/DoxX family redox-associated membrane protein [Thermosporothrix hazakensis]
MFYTLAIGHLSLRMFLGSILISSALTKILHPTNFYVSIRDYRIIPAKKMGQAIASILVVMIPGGEIVIGSALVVGWPLIFSKVGALLLFLIFSSVISLTIIRKRTDILCSCGGILGNHRISWLLVARNVLLLALLLLNIFVPGDTITLELLLSTQRYDPTLVVASIGAAFIISTGAIALIKVTKAIYEFLA